MNKYKRLFTEAHFDKHGSKSFIIEMLEILNQIRVIHWQTKSYALHEATGSYYDFLSHKIDKFVEVYQGAYGKEELCKVQSPECIEIRDMSQCDLVSCFTSYYSYFVNLQGRIKTFSDSDGLSSILDDIIEETNKFIYLSKLK